MVISMHSFVPYVGLLLIVSPGLSMATASETIELFDGQSLDGWVTLEGKPITQGWEVVDGTLRMNHKQGRPGHIKTTQTFENFTLEFEWRIAPGGNSGVKYLLKKSKSTRWGTRYFGCEYQLLDDNKHKNGRIPNKTAGALYDLIAPDVERKQLNPLGQFNHSKIVVDNGHLEHWLNGHKIVEAQIGSDQWQAKINRSKFKTVEGFAHGPGAILLQDHGADTWFRNIRLQKRGQVSFSGRQAASRLSAGD